MCYNTLIISGTTIMNTYERMIEAGISLSDCVLAGYFLDQYVDDSHIQACLFGSVFDDAIREQVSVIDPDIIISLFGCFSPIHSGHIGAALAAKELYENAGKRALVVLQPANDSYVDIKRGGVCKMPAMQRIQQIKQYLEENSIDGVIIDEHPALCMPYELNFPYLLQRISTLAPGVKQSVVVGADNQYFALANSYMGHDTVILPRDGVDINVYPLLEKYGFDTQSVHIIENTTFSHLSSTLIRGSTVVEDHEMSGTYFIRDDSVVGGFDANVSSIKSAFETIFYDTGVTVNVIDANEQILMCSDYIDKEYSGWYVLSMDKYFTGDFQIFCSRIFKNMTYQKKPVGYVIENEDELVEYLKKLPTDANVLVVDDDISSGYSFNKVKDVIMNVLPHSTIKGFFMNLYYMNENGINGDVYDIVDVRDFVEGVKYGGLNTVEKRVPYKYPFVNLFTRAKIPFNSIMDFNRLVWG